jgi:hypothetical protein
MSNVLTMIQWFKFILILAGSAIPLYFLFEAVKIIKDLQTQISKSVKIERIQSFEFLGIKWQNKRTIEICPSSNDEIEK